MFSSACPIFPSADFEKTKTFYASLGFSVASEYPAQGYLILHRDSVEVHFFRYPQHIAAESYHGAFFRIQDAEALSAEYETLALPPDGHPRFIKAEDKPWGVRELVIVDIDGNLLRFGQDIPTSTG